MHCDLTSDTYNLTMKLNDKREQCDVLPQHFVIIIIHTLVPMKTEDTVACDTDN